MLVCSRCGNSDKRTFGINKEGKSYCRLCISFKEEKITGNINIKHQNIKPQLKYPLSKEQQEISMNIKESFIRGKDSIIYAVCGAGKTELVYQVMGYCLSKGLQVGFAIPRKDVVIELVSRIREVFPKNKIVGLYSSSTNEKKADIIVLTTHQLYRYEKYFDLLIIDEVDAFPFKDNIVLNKFFFNSIRGNFIMMSATLDKDNIDGKISNNYDFYRLSKRYHNHPLIVPRVIVSPLFKKFILIYHMLRFSKENKPFLVFLPTINECEELYSFVKLFVKKGNYVHSKKKDRDQIVASFKQGVYRYLLTTSILERGITIKDLQVIVYCADDKIFTCDTLIQISGRVGRKIDSWSGEVIYIAKKTTSSIDESIKKIKKDNDENYL